MWRIFKEYEPLDENSRDYFHKKFEWLLNEFPDKRNTKMYKPTVEDFPIKGLDFEQRILFCKKILCEAMNIPEDKVLIVKDNFYVNKVTIGSSDLLLETDSNESKFKVGNYRFLKKESIHKITIDESCKDDFNLLLSTLSHEFCHIKLLGEKRIKDNDECLTDMCIVFFGFGIFSANKSFEYINTGDYWKVNKYGYLTSKEWAYCLAIFSIIRNEKKTEWSKYLSNNIKRDFEKSLKYLIKKNIKIG